LDVPALLRWAADHRGVAGFPGGKPLTTPIVEYACDILIPAALENQITARNAGNIKAKIVAEAANGPTTPDADQILFKDWKFMIPDILCNAGGVTVSYFEWVQDLQSFFWTSEEIADKLSHVMTRAYQDVDRQAHDHKCDMRMGAYMLAIGRVAEATRIRGIYP
ncbi:MAG: glutamate dehydrogenase, partial [Euryarchaeota archaeon]|nr:glutamate dehydrogenase [Euryarchaeota archaeon]